MSEQVPGPANHHTGRVWLEQQAVTAPPSATWRWLRRALLLTVALEASGAAVLVWWGLMEDRSWRIARPLGQVAAVFLAACIVPAFVMAWAGRSLALAALLLALPAGLALWGRFG